ncbi:MAG: serine protease [Robiginitomaculum sp.]
MKFLKKIPDWLVYGILLFVIFAGAKLNTSTIYGPSPPPDLGSVLQNARPEDPTVIVEINKPMLGIGTAFSVDNNGTWLTARHVVDSCDQVGLRLDGSNYVSVKVHYISGTSDTALLVSKWKRPAFARDFHGVRRTGEHGFFMGFAQGRPGEAAGQLLGRQRMFVKGRYRSSETVLAWSEIGRSRNIKGTLSGISGGPVFDSNGEVIGLITAESPRKGRIYTVAPKSLNTMLKDLTVNAKADILTLKNYGTRADKYRRNRRIAQVVCLVE